MLPGHSSSSFSFISPRRHPAWLGKAGVEAGELPDVQMVQAAKLRRLLAAFWEAVQRRRLREQVGARVQRASSKQRVERELLGVEIGPKLTPEKLPELWKDFRKAYSQEILGRHMRPCGALVQTIFAQKNMGS